MPPASVPYKRPFVIPASQAEFDRLRQELVDRAASLEEQILAAASVSEDLRTKAATQIRYVKGSHMTMLPHPATALMPYTERVRRLEHLLTKFSAEAVRPAPSADVEF